MHARYSHTYAALPERFHAAVQPTAVRAPTLIAWNDALAAELGIDVTAIDPAQLARYCAGNEIPPGARPLAMAYAGHQFGSFVPQLGDGRALLLGEVVDAYGHRRDLQWKGAGQTPYSRRGDGRSALGPVLREYLVSEAMHALGIPSTRALAAVTTGEHVLREDGPLPGGVLIRVAASHVRIGTFEYFAAREDVAGVRLLADHVIDRHYPDLRGHDEPYAALLQAVAERQAALVARWLQVGFIHGVMNTDNMTVSGETIDFGPCAFMDEYDPATVFSYIDRRGRYAYGNQPHILQWNLARFAETLLPLARRRHRPCRRARDGDRRRHPGTVCAVLAGWVPPQARPGHGRAGRRVAAAGAARGDAADAGRLHQHLPRPRGGRRGPGASDRRLAGLDRALAGARGARGSYRQCPGLCPACRQPGLHPAQSPGRGGTVQRPSGTATSSPSIACGECWPRRTTTSRERRNSPPLRLRTSASAIRSAAPELVRVAATREAFGPALSADARPAGKIRDSLVDASRTCWPNC